MRTRTILAITLTAVLVALTTFGASPAAAQAPGAVVGFQYNLMKADGLNLNGVAVDYDRPVWGDHVRLAAGGAFVTGSLGTLSVSQTFAGAGPGIRHDTGSFEVWAHALFGYRRDAGRTRRFGGSQSGFDARFAAGIDYPLGRSHSLRASAAYGGNAHVTAGMAFRF
jgi:hypothetical protein